MMTIDPFHVPKKKKNDEKFHKKCEFWSVLLLVLYEVKGNCSYKGHVDCFEGKIVLLRKLQFVENRCP
jgi:hypothetical protein